MSRTHMLECENCHDLRDVTITECPGCEIEASSLIDTEYEDSLQAHQNTGPHKDCTCWICKAQREA